MWTKAGKKVQPTGARNVLSLLLALWVSLAVQPCAVAAPSEHDCPHCPPEAAADAGAQHHHKGAAGHHVTGAAADCASMPSDCCDLDDSIVSLRVDLPDFDDVAVFLPGTPAPRIPDTSRGPVEFPAPGPDLSGASVPIHVLKCVFLK